MNYLSADRQLYCPKCHKAAPKEASRKACPLATHHMQHRISDNSHMNQLTFGDAEYLGKRTRREVLREWNKLSREMPC